MNSDKSLNRKNTHMSIKKKFFKKFGAKAEIESENRKILAGGVHGLIAGLVEKEKARAREIVPLIHLVNDNKNKEEFLRKAAIEMNKEMKKRGSPKSRARTMPVIPDLDALESPTKKFIIKNSSPRKQRSPSNQARGELVPDDLSITMNSLETSGFPRQDIIIADNLEIDNRKSRFVREENFDL